MIVEDKSNVNSIFYYGTESLARFRVAFGGGLGAQNLVPKRKDISKGHKHG